MDRRIGERIRERRIALGLTQKQLGKELNISFQQVQKYENGQNKIAAALLYKAAYILQMPVAWFYMGTEECTSERTIVSDDADAFSGHSRLS